MECGACMNSGGSNEICRSSLPINWHLTLSDKYRALKPTPSRGQVIFEAMRVGGSESRAARRGWPAHEAQFTYKGTRLGKEYPKGNTGRSINN